MNLEDYKERWSAIPGWPYEASTGGAVRRIGKSAPLRQALASSGYLQVTLSARNTQKSCLVHRLCLLAFSGPMEGAYAAHLDGNPLNNRLDNLQWVTAKENEGHKALHGTRLSGDKSNPRRFIETVARGEASGRAKLKESDIREIRTRFAVGDVTRQQLAREFGVSLGSIAKIVTFMVWRHVH